MKHHFLFLGKTKDQDLQKCIDTFCSRLIHYTDFTVCFIKDTSNRKNAAKQKEEQGKLLLKAVPAGAYKVVLDSRGRQFTSDAFSDFLIRLEVQSRKHICYLIGGAEGLSQEVLNAADLQLSIAKMTFTHDMIRLLLVEQIYRAYTIKAGEKYHK